MFHHVKELQLNARVSKPDVQFAKLLLEQLVLKSKSKKLKLKHHG